MSWDNWYSIFIFNKIPFIQVLFKGVLIKMSPVTTRLSMTTTSVGPEVDDKCDGSVCVRGKLNFQQYSRLQPECHWMPLGSFTRRTACCRFIELLLQFQFRQSTSYFDNPFNASLPLKVPPGRASG